MKICFGVVDIPYDYGDTSETTYTVAEILEDNYRLFTHFYELHEKEILEEVRDNIVLQLANAIQNGVAPSDMLLLGKTQKAFSAFLEKEEMAGLSVDGVPTKAALMGVNSRKKIRHGERRPSFIDGGQFLSSFVAWIENNA